MIDPRLSSEHALILRRTFRIKRLSRGSCAAAPVELAPPHGRGIVRSCDGRRGRRAGGLPRALRRGFARHRRGPRFNYGNRAALDLFEMNWEAFATLRSRHSAEAPDRAEQETVLAEVVSRGFIENYAGVRVRGRGGVFASRRPRCGTWPMTTAHRAVRRRCFPSGGRSERGQRSAGLSPHFSQPTAVERL